MPASSSGTKFAVEPPAGNFKEAELDNIFNQLMNSTLFTRKLQQAYQ